jgi:hypothetical protein
VENTDRHAVQEGVDIRLVPSYGEAVASFYCKSVNKCYTKAYKFRWILYDIPNVCFVLNTVTNEANQGKLKACR